MGEIRLQKFLADAGVASRRKSEELIKDGRVTVNGTIITELGTRVSDEDEVYIGNKRISVSEEHVYIMINKPAGCITSVKDQFSRFSVTDLLDGVCERVYPVGRLDYDTTGLLLLTNDGSLAYKLTHPSMEIEKTYSALVKGVPTTEDIAVFQEGFEIDGRKTSPAKMKVVRVLKNDSIVEITIHEGRNHQVKKMCAAIGHPTITLKRISLGPLTLGGLKEGQWRHLNENEVKILIDS
ncbi:MAG: pseudouridine synthase [Eubacteriales bacterium]|nr:pseudouridine synthase [Eubacteriales bacterium]